ncbi:unnamed protein product [Caenorhabditis sp. 36 PRJEB53466]|nr:unnamed protein product [Caenorhabditis sp. 36 PRJEB53466]
MGSIIKMFKPSKKNSNKENVPAVTFASTSTKSKKPSLNESVYVGEPQKIDLRLKSPYSVITAPKTTRGPMSCPGAPMDDKTFADRQNLMRNSARDRRKSKDDLALSRHSEQFDEQSYRNLVARQQYDMSMSQQYDSDDEDEKYKQKYRATKAENTHLKAKMEKMRAKWREEKGVMTETIDDLSNENYQLRKNHDRLRHKYNETKTNLEMEKRMKCDVLRMLQEANARIEKYEKAGIHDDSLNNSSLLMPAFAANRSSEGAGEALCFPEMNNQNANGGGLSSMFSIFPSSGPNFQLNPLPKSLEDDLEAQDEVRIFRDSVESVNEEEEEDEEMSEEETEQLELGSPLELETVRCSKKRPPIARSQSDPNLSNLAADTVSLAPSERLERPERAELQQHQRQKYTRTSSWLKRNSVNPDDDGSSDSSEEERLSLIERQLKKKGGLVKYNPPRTKIHDKHYKRFGKNERSALAEFEYLQDMSTDVSGLQSSPELGQLMGQLQQSQFRM